MINSIGSQKLPQGNITFGKKKPKVDPSIDSEKDYLMIEEHTKHPISTKIKIGADRLSNALTTYPAKGFKGSINSNFYEFLTMGTIPYLVGSASLMAVFNLAGKFFDAQAKDASLKIGKKMALGVLFYGIAKSLSKKLIETPVKMKYGVDVNLPYRRVINELPDGTNKDDLVSYEYHKAFESVDFPRYDLLYTKGVGQNPNSYYDKVAKKMGLGENLIDSDQKVKPKLRELVTKTRTFTTLSSYLWAATAVGVATQPIWENSPVKLRRVFKAPIKAVKSFGGQLGNAFKSFLGVGESVLTKKHIAGRALFGLAAAVTLIGNIITLTDFKKKKADKMASTPIMNNEKPKVVC